jgi:hypothetical protein
MRLTEFIRPITSGKRISMHEAHALIMQNCNEILNLYRKNAGRFDPFLFRGVRLESDAFISEPINFRQPQDTPNKVQTIIDSKLAAAGFKALRSNSIFCTGNKYNAKFFGSSYVIFPFDGFAFTWSEEIFDLTTDYDLFNDKDSKKPNENSVAFVNTINDMSGPQFVERYGFKNTDLQQAILSEHEIYVRGKYVAVNSDHISWVTDLLDNRLDPPFTVKDEDESLKVTHDPYRIRYIDNPSEQVQLLAVKTDPQLIQYIQNPTEKVKKLALKKDPTVQDYL